MPRHIERLDGGLITDKDPVLLKEGELSLIRNMVYKNGAGPLIKAPGRAVFGTVSSVATGVKGLRDIHFDNGNHYLIAMAGTKLRRFPVGTTGTGSDLATIAESSHLEVVQYRNRFFLMTGATAEATAIGTNVVAYLTSTGAAATPTTRQHGMLPVQAAPNVPTGSGAFSQTVTGYYEYWTTEVARFTQDDAQVELESAFSSDNGVTTVFVSSTAVLPTISLPAVRNALTTHWRIYRSTKKAKESDKGFPVGFMIGELSTASAAHADTTALASASSFPGSFNAANFYFDFASASSMGSDNGVYASATVGGSLVTKAQGSYGFSLGGFSGAVKGIQVEVQGYVSSGSAPVPISVGIGKRRSDGEFFGTKSAAGGQVTLHPLTAYKSASITSTLSGTPTTLFLGSSTDRWFPTNTAGLVDTDFDGNFMVVISVSKPSASIGIDYLKVTAWYSSSVDSTVVFPTVVYSFGDITSQVAKNFPPPSSSTGDLYQDSLVVNDVSNKSLCRWSFPGEPEYFPPSYFIDFETRENDEVTHIRVVNNHLIVGLNTSLWRINYLPSERDASFDRGKAIEMISRSYGIVNPMAACTFTIDGEAEQMAFVSFKGLHTTDGFNFITRSKNQDWRKFIPISSLGQSAVVALLNDPENRCLRLYYQNTSDLDFPNETYLCLWASYDRSDIDGDGNFKFSGPVNCRNFDSGTSEFASLESTWAVPRTTGGTSIYMGYGGTSTAAGGGKVYLETGTNIPSEDSDAQWTTRRIYQAGVSGEWMLDDLYGYCGDYSGSPLIVYSFSNIKTNGAIQFLGSKQFQLSGAEDILFHRVSPRVSVEGLEINMRAAASAFQQELIVFGEQDLGLENSGK